MHAPLQTATEQRIGLMQYIVRRYISVFFTRTTPSFLELYDAVLTLLMNQLARYMVRHDIGVFVYSLAQTRPTATGGRSY
jgi:hypothetical protein